jgi:AcrR family transcriptional regulator
VSRVARKRSLARQRLLDAAIELIADRGVEGLRLRELAERADVGFGSFYTHFATKEELIEAVVAEHLGALAQAILAYAGEHADPAETAAIAHRNFVRLAYEDPQLAWLIIHFDRADALLETASHPHLAPVLERGMRTGRFHGIEIDVAVSFIVGATIAVMRGILEQRLGPGADVASARTLLRACGLPDAEAHELAARELPARERPSPASP